MWPLNLAKGFSFIHSFLSLHPSVPSPARHLPSIVHRTTLQSITITSRKENIKEDEQRNRTDPPTASTLHSPSTPISSPVSPPAQPSLLASLLARKRSTVTVPATKEVSPPLRGSSRPSPDRLPYLPHSPFHLFSYDLDEELLPPAPARPAEEPPKTTSPRSEGQHNSMTHEEQQKFPLFPLSLPLFLSQLSLLFLAFSPGTSLDFFAPLSFFITSLITTSFHIFDCTASHLQTVAYYHFGICLSYFRHCVNNHPRLFALCFPVPLNFHSLQEQHQMPFQILSLYISIFCPRLSAQLCFTEHCAFSFPLSAHTVLL